MAQIYRKTALDKISSPEQLDKSLKITSPLSWLVLVGLTLIVVVVVIWSIVGRIPETITTQGVLVEPNGVCSIFAKESGTVVEVSMDSGDQVSIGTPVLIYRTDSGQEEVLYSDQGGNVYRVLTEKGKRILKGEEVLRISPAVSNRELVAVCYASTEDAKKIRDKVEDVRGTTTDVKARVEVKGIDTQKYGYLEARVFTIDSAQTTDRDNGERWNEVLGANNTLMNKLKGNEATTAIICEFYFKDRALCTGLLWSNEKGYTRTISSGDEVIVKIVASELHPYEKLFQKLSEIWRGEK
jgi:hypothetical protein